MGFGTLVRNAIIWATDYVGKNNVSTGAIKKLDYDIGQIFSAVTTTVSALSSSDDKLPTEQAVSETFIRGDGTAGREFVRFICTISGTDADTASLSTTGVWNHASNITEVTDDACDINATSTGGYWSINAGGDTVTLIAEAKNLGAGDDFIAVISAEVADQNTTAPLHCYPSVSGGNLLLAFTDASSNAVDVTVASRAILVVVTAVITGS